MAKVISHTGRFASLVGYDPNTTKSGRVPIVSAYIKVRSSSIGNYPILLKVHEAPYNPQSPITLLSEYQIREYGLVIDSVAKKHKSVHGKPGTQCFCVSSDVYIDFEDRGGLMGFQMLPIEEGDEQRYDVFTITNPIRWTPRKFKDELLFDGYFYDPTDIDNDVQGYPALINHTTQLNHVKMETTKCNEPDYDKPEPLIESHIYASSLWHRVIHQDIDPMHLRPYLGWRPVKVIKKTLNKTTQMARMITRAPMRRHSSQDFHI